MWSKDDMAKEATTVTNFIAEGEVIVTHSVKSTKLSGTWAIWSVLGSLAGVSSEHVDEIISHWVSLGWGESRARKNP